MPPTGHFSATANPEVIPGTSARGIRFVSMWTKHALFLSCALTLSCGAASAQKPPEPARPAQQQTATPAPAQPTNCAAMPPKGSAPEGSTVGRANEPLGDKLAKSDGVLCPPAGVDPEIRAPTPDTGNTPVIPPPGSPGGDPSVRPK
jgi:hypothetical protein